MMDFIMVPLIMGIITVGTYKLFELFACRRERMAIIEKLGDKISATDLNGKFCLPNYNRTSFSFGALKGGCLMLGVGLGLLVGFFICANYVPNYLIREDLDGWNINKMVSIIYGACVLLCGGIGLLTAFLIESHICKKKD